VLAYGVNICASLHESRTAEGATDTPSTHEITELLVAWNNGDAVALDQLMPLVH